MNIRPIFARDFRTERRLRRIRKDRLVAGAVAGVVLICLALLENYSDVTPVRVMRSIPLAGIAPYCLLVIGLSRGVNLLWSERREGTLPLLLLTRVTGFDILLGKLLGALLLEANTLLAATPALVLPLVIAGFHWEETGLLLLGSANVVLVGTVLGLSSAVFFDEDRALNGCYLLSIPFLILAIPLLPLPTSGPWAALFRVLQALNPGDALGHVSAVAGGFRSSAFWRPLLLSHGAAWGLLLVAGKLLPEACRRRASRTAYPRSWAIRSRSPQSALARGRLLDVNPFLWIASRKQTATVQAWLGLTLSALLWGWLAWWTWASRGINVTFVFVIAIGVGWFTQFLVTVPAEASRQLLADRQSGALEMLLCTPLSVAEMVRGQWCALGRRYSPPLILVVLMSLALMLAGYFTDGFGGMLDANEMGPWICGWLAGIAVLPIAIVALCWVSMRRALFARDVGHASGIAFLQVIGLPSLILPTCLALSHSLLHWNPAWPLRGGFIVAGSILVQVAFARQARKALLRDLRWLAAGVDLPRTVPVGETVVLQMLFRRKRMPLASN